MAERMTGTDGVALCTESFGARSDPPVLLIMGTGASMLWWDEGLCRTLAAGGRFVIRYDHRDTGRSVTYEPGRPGYSGADLADDAVRVLDALGIPAAHLVGVSAGGALAQSVALDHPARVRSLVLVSTSPAVGGGRELPPPTEEFTRFVTTAQVDWTQAASVAEYLVAYARVLAGGRRPFDEDAVRELVRRDIARADDFAAVRNHDVLPAGRPLHRSPASITAPTLVIHGTADPMFPLGHGEALAAAVPGARLLPLENAGHGVDPADRATIARAILAHTAHIPRVHRGRRHGRERFGGTAR
ncbi:alpha/beta fold hydrolase [Streptomyces sp. cmx-4-9]|uniref:alpha/beta fold hydrolase n=1 Tax=Streptomyces sp. cmx-4-9 TaxID=2790941 RepID=UPI00397EBC32